MGEKGEMLMIGMLVDWSEMVDEGTGQDGERCVEANAGPDPAVLYS
jgi:hypothetical protein